MKIDGMDTLPGQIKESAYRRQVRMIWRGNTLEIRHEHTRSIAAVQKFRHGKRVLEGQGRNSRAKVR